MSVVDLRSDTVTRPTAAMRAAMMAAAVGVGALLATSASAFTVLMWVGAAYLLWMGVRLLVARRGQTVAVSPDIHRRVAGLLFIGFGIRLAITDNPSC